MKRLMLTFTFCFLNWPLAAGERVSLDGYAEWHRGDVLIVEGQRVHAGSRTRFDGARSLATIPLGYEVKVRGERMSDGSVLASKVESKRNGSAMFEGELSRASDDAESQWRRRGYVFAEDGKRIGRLEDDGPDVERVRRIVNRLVPPSHSASEFRSYVVDNDEWNAMAAPNGSVYVFSGLLKATDDDEMAIILGHELVHATHEHSRRQYKRSMWTQLGLAGVLAVTQSDGRDVRGTVAQTGALLGALAFQNRYSRQHEDQADRVGLRYAYEAGYDVSKAPHLWRRFAQKYGGQPEALNFFFGSHSSPAARSRNLELEIRRNYR